MEITIFYIPIGTEVDAHHLSDMAISKKLAACANLFPVSSAFTWQGKIEKENEFVLIIKTLVSHTEQLRQLIESHHPYDVPCILSYSAQVNDAYGKWMAEQVKSENRSES